MSEVLTMLLGAVEAGGETGVIGALVAAIVALAGALGWQRLRNGKPAPNGIDAQVQAAIDKALMAHNPNFETLNVRMDQVLSAVAGVAQNTNSIRESVGGVEKALIELKGIMGGLKDIVGSCGAVQQMRDNVGK